MSIGSGIFFSALIFAIVYLYKITRDRLDWRKVARRSLIGFASIIAFVALGLSIMFVYENIQEIPHRATAYADLRLGMSMAEVKYVKGYPTDVLENLGEESGDTKGFRRVIAVTELKNGQKVEHYATWEYAQTDQKHRIEVDFDNIGTLNQIACFSQDTTNCPILFGIRDGTSENALLEKLGNPTNEEIDGVTKRIEYQQLGAWFYLEKKKVYMIGVVGNAAPPCKAGKLTCSPWERDWGSTKLAPGITVTEGGSIGEHSAPK
jgi:hypothetical protein